MALLGFPLTYWLVGGVVVLVGAAIIGLGYLFAREKRRAAEAVERIETADGDELNVGLEAPEPADGLWDLIKLYRHRARAKKLAKKGYVRWYKIDASMGKPEWVKPTSEGAGELEYYDSDEEVTYLFPKNCMVHDSFTGAWVAVHRKGEAEPINLKDPAAPPIPTDRLEEIINLEAESDAPGFFDRMNIDGETVMWAMIAIVMLFAGAQQLMGGGF